MYEASLNKKIFHQQNFDGKLLETGRKKLMLDATFDVIEWM